jgi:5-hydroxyisourate hydrolase
VDDLALDRTTDRDGRIADLLGGGELLAGIYEIRFDLAAHEIDKERRPRFFWTVALHFEVTDTSRSYHVPLLLSPYGLSTYRGS